MKLISIMSKRNSKFVLAIILLLMVTGKSIELAESLNSDTGKCTVGSCIKHKKYTCKLELQSPTDCPCPCDVTDSSTSINTVITWVSVVSLLFSFVLIMIFFESEDLRRPPGDIIMGLAIVDLILSSRMLIYSGLSLIFPEQNPDGVQCTISSTVFIFTEYLQVFYNFFFFAFLIIQLRTTLKASSFPQFLYHLLPILLAAAITTLYTKTKSVGMAMDGVCSQKTDLDMTDSVVLFILGIGIPGYTYYHLKVKVPRNEKINKKTKEFMEYYSVYALAVTIIYLCLSLSGFLIYIGLTVYMRDNETTDLIKIGYWIQSVIISANPIILTVIRINDPLLKQHWDIIFPCFREKTTASVDKDEDKAPEYEKSDAKLKMSEEKMPLKRKESMSGEMFENMMENTSTLLQIKHNLKVQVIYSIIASLHQFWNIEAKKNEFGKFYGMNFREAAQQKKTIEITEDILQENLPYFLTEIKAKKYGASDGKLTVYAPKLFNLLCTFDGVGQNFLDSLDLQDNFNRIVKAGTNTKGGQSGEFFFFSADNKLIIKSMKDSELKLFLKILPAYVNHFKKYPSSLISKIYSVVTFETGESLGKEKYNLLVMRNINGYPSRNVVRSYDLKGSTYGRRTIKEEGPIDKSDLGNHGTLKDLDFLDHEHHININPEVVDDFVVMIKRDTDFLKEHNLLDYSFLVLVVDHMLPVPTRKTYYRRKNRQLSVVFEVAPEKEALTSKTSLSDDADLFGPGKSPEAVFNMDDNSLKNKDFTVLKMIDGTYYYHVGIIDYLIEYGWKKKLEVFFKKFIACNPNLDISVQRPEYYAQRFVNFVSRIVK